MASHLTTRERELLRGHELGDPEAHRYVRERMERRWSPDQIAARSRLDFPRQPGRWLSRQTIHDWIRERAPDWRPWLRRGGRPPERRGKLVDCARIDGRPDDMTAATTTRVMTRRMRDPPPALRRSVTFDNGEDFAEHKRFAEACDLEVYFALPYRSWQRGANENTNGPPRKSLPKSCAAFDS